MNNKVSIFANDVQAPIKVELHENGEYFVSARELHQFLGSQADFTDWCKRMFAYGFRENEDYSVIYIDDHKNVVVNIDNMNAKQRSRHGIQTEYWLTFRCAQHIGMIQKSTEGRIIRDYFISCEERLNRYRHL